MSERLERELELKDCRSIQAKKGRAVEFFVSSADAKGCIGICASESDVDGSDMVIVVLDADSEARLLAWLTARAAARGGER
jgi:hypothetical protein